MIYVYPSYYCRCTLSTLEWPEIRLSFIYSGPGALNLWPLWCINARIPPCTLNSVDGQISCGYIQMDLAAFQPTIFQVTPTIFFFRSKGVKQGGSDIVTHSSNFGWFIRNQLIFALCMASLNQEPRPIFIYTKPKH